MKTLRFTNMSRDVVGDHSEGDQRVRYLGNADLAQLFDRDPEVPTCYDVPRISETPDGYQRDLEKSRVEGVQKSLQEGKKIWGDIILVVPIEARVRYTVSGDLEIDLDPPNSKILILDGQHRIAGAEAYLRTLEEWPCLAANITLLVGYTSKQAAAVFHDLNFLLKKVSGAVLAEARHRGEQESPQEKAAGMVYDTLMEGVLRGTSLKRAQFYKPVIPLLVKSGPLGAVEKASIRRKAVILYITTFVNTVGQLEGSRSRVLGGVLSFMGQVYTHFAVTRKNWSKTNLEAFFAPLGEIPFTKDCVSRNSMQSFADFFRETLLPGGGEDLMDDEFDDEGDDDGSEEAVEAVEETEILEETSDTVAESAA